MPDFLAARPEALPAIQAALAAEPPESYATCVYNSIHSFRWTAPDGAARWVRYRMEPEAGESSLSVEQARRRGRDYLREDLRTRREIAFRVVVVIADDGDAIGDPTVAWPSERERVDVGRLVLDRPETEREREGDILVFDPTRVTEGIELSDPALSPAPTRSRSRPGTLRSPVPPAARPYRSAQGSGPGSPPRAAIVSRSR